MDNTLFELADQLKVAKDRKKQLDAEVKENNAVIEDLDRRLSDAMAEQEVDRFSRNGSLFYLSSRLFASPKAGEKETMIAALKANGYGDLVIETVNSGTLSSFAKERMAETETGDLPDWLADIIQTFENIFSICYPMMPKPLNNIIRQFRKREVINHG